MFSRRPKTRAQARAAILAAANRYRLARDARFIGQINVRPLLSPRHIEQAVCIARRNRLVGDDVLALAGYRTSSGARIQVVQP